MRPQFPLFQNHKDHVHSIWKQFLKPGFTVCDATCGNGHDSAILASLCLSDDAGSLYCVDIQGQAIKATRQRLEALYSKNILTRVILIKQSHEQFPDELTACDLFVYNLGYLPQSSKMLTTEVASTIKSLQSALSILNPGGLITIMCYPGHAEGAQEELALINFSNHLDPKQYLVYHQKIMNRDKAPSLLVIGKKLN